VKVRRGFLALAAVLAVGSLAYFLASGTRPGAPLVFAVGGAVALAVSIYLISRSALALLLEPQSDELRVATGRRRKELEREKQLLLKALKELSFDHEMHKISDADYQEITATYRGRAVRIMRQLDEGAEFYRRTIAEELAARRGGPQKEPAPAEAAPEGPEAADSGAAKEAPSSVVDGRLACARCGAANEPDAVFCKKCGGRVAAEATP
jgi:hypothetical protein